MKELDSWIQKKKFDEWLTTHPDAGRELNNDGDMILVEYPELKQPDTKDYLGETI